MAVTDLASVGAAQGAGYKLLRQDRGSFMAPNLRGPQPARFQTTLEKTVTGAPGSGSGFLQSGFGESNVSQAAADAQALVSLNALRRHRYGGAGGRASGDAQSLTAKGGTQVVDVT